MSDSQLDNTGLAEYRTPSFANLDLRASQTLGRWWPGTWLLLPLATLPLAFLQVRLIRQPANGPALNDLLAKTAQLAFFYSVLLAIGLILS